MAKQFNRVSEERNQTRRRKQMHAKPDGYITCRFRIVTRTGEVRPMKAQARFRDHPVHGKLFFVMLMEADADEGCTTCGASQEKD